MALTETRPDASGPSGHVAPPAPKGLVGALGSGDHKVIGRLYVFTSLVLLVGSLVLGLLVTVDGIDPGRHRVLSNSNFFQIFTLNSTSLVLLGLIPLLLGLAIIVVPLQIGARAIAFPRAVAASYWTYLVGAGLTAAATAANGGPGGTSAHAVDLWIAAQAMVVVGLLLAAVCVVTTVFSHRTVGMRLTRVPLFSWSMVVAGGIWLLTLPVLLVLLVLAYVDHRAGHIFNGPTDAGALFSNIQWVLFQPQVYAFVLPALGIVGDIIPTFARARNDIRHVGAMTLLGLFGVTGLGAYTITAYVSFGQGSVPARSFHNPVIIVQAVLTLVAVLGLCGLWADSFRRGRAVGKPVKGSPLVFAMAAILLVVLAAIAGAAAPIERFKLHGTLFDLAQSHLAIVAGILGGLAGLDYWSSKVQGRQLLDVAGLGSAALTMLGGLGLAAGEAASGLFGKGAELTTGTKAFNTLSAAGATALVIGVVIALGNAVYAVRSQTPVDDDPWEAGQTLEWATASPPAYDNFADVPPVSSEAPVLDLREGPARKEGAAR